MRYWKWRLMVFLTGYGIGLALFLVLSFVISLWRPQSQHTTRRESLNQHDCGTADSFSSPEEILAALKSLSVDSKDIQTTYLSLQPQFDYKKGMRISYFVAEQTLTVKLHDVSKIDELLDALIKAGGNRVDGIEYQSSEMRKYRDQARQSAVNAAREKAEALAKALGQQIGKAYSIQEDQPQEYSPYANAITGGLVPDKTRAPVASTSPGQMKVSAAVTVTFELI